ncbi:glycosyltransferase family 2 protein [bacterium]|nr:MAG: glycosyltransferase family 2 protein [bacterium]
MIASPSMSAASDEEPACSVLVSLVIPAYNEGATLASNLESILRCTEAYRGRYRFELIVVDDGSTDGTYDAAEETARRHAAITLLRHDGNRGLGAALRTGFARARGRYVVTLDADLSYAPAEAIRLVETLVDERADIALASVYMPGGSVVNVPWIRRLLSREANRFLSLAVNARLRTLTCMVRAYRAAVLPALGPTSDGMEANPEMLFAALRCGAKVVEVPARLEWSRQRAQAGARLYPRRVTAQTLRILQAGLAYRPALWLGIPGLVPGLLPLTVIVLLFLRVPPAAFAGVTLAVVVIQYASVAVLAGQITAFAGRLWFQRRVS